MVLRIDLENKIRKNLIHKTLLSVFIVIFTILASSSFSLLFYFPVEDFCIPDLSGALPDKNCVMVLGGEMFQAFLLAFLFISISGLAFATWLLSETEFKLHDLLSVKTTDQEYIKETILESAPEDWAIFDERNYVYKKLVDLRILRNGSSEEERSFEEPWVKKYADSSAYLYFYDIFYGSNLIDKIPVVLVDGGRVFIPLPKSMLDLTITKYQYKIGLILNFIYKGKEFDRYLKTAGIMIH